MTIVITGGSGFVGTKLSKKLLDKGYTVIVVDLHAPTFTNEKLFFIPCDLTKSIIPFGVLEHADAVVNLSGAPISQKWNEEVQKVIYDSRIESTKHVVQSFESTHARPGVLVNASAIGFYGETGESISDEKTPAGKGFLAKVVTDWETEANKASAFGVRVVLVRTAPVLGLGGMLALYTQTARFGFLLGLQKDFMLSWIHIEDLVDAYIFAIETSTVQGIINAAAPETTTYKKLMLALSHTIHRRAFFFIPKKIALYVFGVDGYEELTVNQLAKPSRLLDKGFVFTYPTLQSALTQIYPVVQKNHEKSR